MTAPRPPAGLQERGKKLWREMMAPPVTWTPERITLIEELCRLADRTEFLDKLLRGDETLWLRLTLDRDERISVSVDHAMVECRLAATAMKQIVGELRQARTERKPEAKPASAPAVKSSGGGNVTSLADAAKRRAGTQG